jgi:predicted transcriptional regulator
MTVGDVVNILPLTVVAGASCLDKSVKCGYTSDLLSNVMGFAAADSVWITMQGHQNIVAVALLAGLAAVIVAGGVKLELDTVEKASSEGVVLLTTELPSFEVAGRLYELGVRGT